MMGPELKPEITNVKVFVNLLLSKLTKAGSKAHTFKTYYDFLMALKAIYKRNPYVVLDEVLSKGALRFGFVEYSAGGKKYLVPIVVDPAKARYDFIGSFLKNALSRTEPTLVLKLVAEVQDFLLNKGGSYKEKMQSYVLARQNKFYAKKLYDAISKKKKKKKYNVAKNIRTV
jgi:ribosomal protein S7